VNRLRRAWGAVAAAAVLALAPVSAASAADGTIAHVEGTDDGLQILVSVPPDANIDLDGVSVTLDGQTADAAAVLADTDTRIRRTTILAIDTSDSMAGARFEAAKTAALAFIDSVPDDVYVGIVSFDAEVKNALAPTTDRDQARSVIDSLQLNRDTLLYDGVLSALDLAGTEGQRSVLVLSDGADTSSTKIATVASAIQQSEATVDVVALEQADDEIAFSGEAAILASQVLVTAQIPAGFTESQATVSVTLPSSAGDITASAYSTIQAPGASAPDVAFPEPGAEDDGWSTPGWLIYAGVGVFAVGLLLVLLMLTAAERITTYTRKTGAGADVVPTEGPEEDIISSAKQAAAEVLARNRTLEARIAHRLEGAGSELKASEWLLLHAIIFVGVGALGLLIGQGNLVIGLIFMALGAIGPWVYLAFRRQRRRKAFHGALPDTLQLISGSLAAGLSLAQSLDTVVREGQEPVAGEFKRVLVETRLGVPLEEALSGVAERFESRDFEWVVMAIKIQREVGGNLAELLDTVAATMREREYIRRQVNALAAEGKLSAVVLSVLPPAFLLYLFVAEPSYVSPLFHDARGIGMVVGAALWLVLGVLWMKKLVKVEV
jgi:tight adherence protein B